MRALADRYAGEALPTPLRWLWALLVSWTLPFGPRALQTVALVVSGPIAAWAVAPLVGFDWRVVALTALSPLAVTVGRRALQDTPVAVLTMALLGMAVRHNAYGFTACLISLISIREASILVLPAIAAMWLIVGGDPKILGVSVAASGAGVLLPLALIFRSRLVPLLRRFTSTKNTEYQKKNNGAMHSLLASLMIVSPMPLTLAIQSHASTPSLTAALSVFLIVHSVFPIRNPRFIIAGDILLRIIAALAVPWWAIPILGVADLWAIYRLRNVYDPMPAALASAFGMPKQTE